MFQDYLSYLGLSRLNREGVPCRFDDCGRGHMKVVDAENPHDLSEESGQEPKWLRFCSRYGWISLKRAIARSLAASDIPPAPACNDHTTIILKLDSRGPKPSVASSQKVQPSEAYSSAVHCEGGTSGLTRELQALQSLLVNHMALESVS
jgi:hypothetical protein